MPRAKTQTKAKKPTTAELIEQTVQEQLMEALQNIEISIPEQDAYVDMDLLREEIKKEVQNEMKQATPSKDLSAEDISISKSEIRLTGSAETYWLTSDGEGFQIEKGVDKSKNVLAINSSGALGVGIKSPRSSGRGSAHFRAWYPSEAPLPTSGDGSTRGVIVEGDGDDNKTYTLRVVSRKNRQGFNVTSDGKLVMGQMENACAKITALQNEFDEPGAILETVSKQYQNDVLVLKSSTAPTKNFNLISGTSDGHDVFRVDGEGTVHTETGFMSNRCGYAEIFEWEDGNHRNEDRTGFTVTLNEKGQIRIADEGDTVIGVIGKSAAVIGNAAWNAWQHRYRKTDSGEPLTVSQKIVEWEDEVGVLHTHYLDSLSDNFALPDNAIIYETDGDGEPFEVKQFVPNYNQDEPYTQRLDRGWGLVIITGRVSVFKGQLMNPSWFKIKGLSDDLEEWFLK